MKRLLCVLIILMIGAPLARSADAPTLTFYVQLLRGSDQDAPPGPDAQLIGDKLGHRLHGVFKWKNYWEIKRETVALKTNDKVRKRMSPQQEVEIALEGPHDMTVSIYTNNKLTRTRKQPVETQFYIAGGDTDDTQSWFIVVRRDLPDTSDASRPHVVAMP